MRFVRVLVVLLVLAAAAVWWFALAPVSPAGGDSVVELQPGTRTAQMSRQLEQAGVIRSAFAFQAVRALKGGTLQAGEYHFAEPANVFAVYSRIARGDVWASTVTVPEGSNLWDIATALERAGLPAAATFVADARANTRLIADLDPAAPSLEGYLFPDTYRIPHRSTAVQIQQTMVTRLRRALAGAGVGAEQTHRVLTLASLVEKEVRSDAERHMAAAVFQNRLERGMPLQTDPTVIYAALQAGTWAGTIHRSDLDRDSPWNTYRHTGLPPGPICSPGLAAIRAVQHPASTEALYFVADGAGGTRFSAGLAEHAAQVEQYRDATSTTSSVPSRTSKALTR